MVVGSVAVDGTGVEIKTVMRGALRNRDRHSSRQVWDMSGWMALITR